MDSDIENFSRNGGCVIIARSHSTGCAIIFYLSNLEKPSLLAHYFLTLDKAFGWSGVATVWFVRQEVEKKNSVN